MADSGIFRINPIQGWQRDAILKAAAFLREQYGNPPGEAAARLAHDGLLEVLDPARRTARLQQEISEATRKAVLAEKAERKALAAERRARERRIADRRKVNAGPPPGSPERRRGPIRTRERRSRR
jgi:hypothetical protein